MELGSIRVTTPAGTVELGPGRTHVIGRGREADLAVAHAKVSRRHVELSPGPDGWVARDLSTNGVWHNGARVAEVPVHGEVTIRLGAQDGPEVRLRGPARPVPPAAGDNSEAETVLAGQGSRTEPPRPAAGGPVPTEPGPVPAGRQPGPAVPSQGPAAPQPGPRGAPAGGRGGSSVPALAGWARLLPTLVWLAAVGFSLGALIALG